MQSRQQAQLEERAAQQDTLLAMQYTQYQQLSRHIEEVRERATTCAST